MSTPAPDAVKRLVDRFDQDRKVFVSTDYKEEQLRAEFLNPFFTALGRDMDDKQGLSEFSVIADSVHSPWLAVPGTEDRKPGTKNREPGTDEVIRLTAGHQAKVEEKPECCVPCGPVFPAAESGGSALTGTGKMLRIPDGPAHKYPRPERSDRLCPRSCS